MKWSEEQRDAVRAAAERTTEPTPGEMPGWVKNKSACRWAWAHDAEWRRVVDVAALNGERRAEMVRWARRIFGEEMRRRDVADREGRRDE